MITEQEQKIVDTAKRLKITVGTKGWQDILGYAAVRTNGLKNELAKMDLVKDVSRASQKQGVIEGLKSIINRANNVIAEAEKIEEAMREEKKKKEKK